MNRAGHIDYVPSLFTFTRRVDEVRKSEISERERRSIKRKLRELNHQPSCKVRRRSVRIRAEENASGDGEAEENGNGVHVSEEDAAEGNEDERNDAEENGDGVTEEDAAEGNEDFERNGDGVTEEDAAEGNEDERNDAEENGDRAEEQSILPGCVANETAIINQYTSTSIQAVPVPVVCYVPVTSVPSKSQFGVAIIEGNNEATKFYTGLATWKLFQYLLSFLVGAYPPQAKRSKISPANGLLLVLMRLRLNLRVEDLSYRFSISLSTVSDIFQRWIDLLFTHLSFLIHWPSQEIVHNNMPQIFKDLYPRTRCIIDCSEVFIERPCAYQARAKTYSNYKKHNTIKFLIGITPNGAISFLSKCWGGRATDKCITKNSGFLDLVEHGDVILADRGFDIADDLGVYGARLEIPSFTRGKNQLSLQEVEYSKRLSKVRIHVERVIGLLKNKYTFLQSTLPVNLLRHRSDSEYANIDKIITVCAAITNLSPSVVPL